MLQHTAWDLLNRPHDHTLTRRRLFGSAAVAAGLAVGADLIVPVAAWAEPAKNAGTPRPIPGGIQPFGPTGPLFHVNVPPESETRTNDDFSTIFDFNGTVGLSHLHGTGVGVTGGVSKNLNFDMDCRFLTGHFVGTDEQLHRGTFSFVWLDVFDGPVGTNQIHDFNPGITPEGVFWTTRISDGVDVDVDDGQAELEVNNLDVDDYFNVVNALLDQSGQPGNHTPVEIPAQVSFEINWQRVRDRFRVVNPAQHYEASVVLNESSIRWTAHEAAAEGAPSFSFRSTSSTNVFSMLAREKNGRFFKS